jgi:hypothetical protein
MLQEICGVTSGAVVPRQAVSRDRRALYADHQTKTNRPTIYFKDGHKVMRLDGEVYIQRKN